MNAVFDYITGGKSGREAELEASLEHMGGYLGIEIEDNEKLRAELAHIHKDRTAWANVELSEENDRLIADNEKLRAEIGRLRELVKDLADDLESEVEGHYIGVKDHPAMMPKFERDMANVRKARRVLEQNGVRK